MEGCSLAWTPTPPAPAADLERTELETRKNHLEAPPLPEHHTVTLDWISLKGNHLPKSVLHHLALLPSKGQTVPLVPCQSHDWHRRSACTSQRRPGHGSSKGGLLINWSRGYAAEPLTDTKCGCHVEGKELSILPPVTHSPPRNRVGAPSELHPRRATVRWPDGLTTRGHCQRAGRCVSRVIDFSSAAPRRGFNLTSISLKNDS